MPANGYEYPGNELALFSRATRWKKYWGRQMSAYVAGDVLEPGAGNGVNQPYLINPGVICWTQLEPDAGMCTALQNSSPGKGHQVICGTLQDLPGVPAFDTILYLDVLEHIKADRQELADAAERLRPGGHLIILAPAHAWLFSPFDHAVGHERRYTHKDLKQIMPGCMQKKRLRYLDSAGMLASAANRFLLKQAMPGPRQIRFWDRWLVPVSRVLDPLSFYTLGKSVLGIWQKNES